MKQIHGLGLSAMMAMGWVRPGTKVIQGCEFKLPKLKPAAEPAKKPIQGD